MGANNNDGVQTKADLILDRLEKLSQKTSILESKMESVLTETQERALDREAILQQLAAENKELLQELKYISAQQTSIYRGMDKSMSAISGKMDGAQGVPVQASDVDVEALAQKVAEKLNTPVGDLDYDVLAQKVAEKLKVTPAIDYDELGYKVVQNMYIPSAIVEDIDYDQLADKLKDRPDEVISPDYIASKVAEQISYPAINEEALARNISELISVPASTENINLDSREIADCIAKQVGSVAPEQFDILVDEDGCDTLAKAIVEKLDVEAIANAVAEKLNASAELQENNEVDSEEVANKVAEKLGAAQKIDEEALADKAAAVLSNYIAVDTDEIAEKVISGVIPAIPEANDADIADKVFVKIVEKQSEQDFDIVLDEDGVQAVSSNVADRIKGEYIERFDKVDKDIEEIKKILLAGMVVAAADELAPAAAEESDEEDLVTVSNLVDEEEQQETNAEIITEAVDEGVIEEVTEEPTEAEINITTGGVDFMSMMKYNRSFIARIIQSTDEQKQYYGQVKNALLSYKKVNSNIAWGAERFNKGRETIARFKIRGKTLCLYLALDPNEFAMSVYHHADVSDNKSLSGTPMMVKIKSPLGVKKAIRLIDTMLARRDGIKQNVSERDYAAMYPYETIEELIEDGLVKDVRK